MIDSWDCVMIWQACASMGPRYRGSTPHSLLRRFWLQRHKMAAFVLGYFGFIFWQLEEEASIFTYNLWWFLFTHSPLTVDLVMWQLVFTHSSLFLRQKSGPELWPRLEDVCWLSMWILTENTCSHNNSGPLQIKHVVGLEAEQRLSC